MFDEINCGMVIIEKQLYHKENPPINKATHKTQVKVDIVIDSLDKIDEVEMVFTAKFSVRMQWYVLKFILKS
jgi:hypothetical protein